MALPRQIQEQQEEWDRLFTPAAETETPPEPAETPSEPQQPPDPAPQPPDPAPQPQPSSQQVSDFWRAKHAQDVGALQSQMQQLQQQIAELSRPQAAPEPQGPQFAFDGQVTALNKDEIEAIGGDATVQAIARVAQEVVTKMLSEHFTNLQNEVRSTQESVVSSSQAMHDRAILQAHQDAAQLFQNETMMRWLGAQKLPYGNGTKLDRLRDAHENLETSVVIDLLKEFKDAVAAAKQKKQQEQQNSAHVPNTTSSATPQSNKPAQFKVSELERATTELVKGHITQAQFNEIEKKYNAALQSGNLVFDA